MASKEELKAKLHKSLESFLNCCFDLYFYEDKTKQKEEVIFCEKNDPEYCTVKQLAKRFPGFSEASIRSLIFNSEDVYKRGKKNGFDKCIRRIGRKVIINVDEFKKFIDDQKPKS